MGGGPECPFPVRLGKSGAAQRLAVSADNVRSAARAAQTGVLEEQADRHDEHDAGDQRSRQEERTHLVSDHASLATRVGGDGTARCRDRIRHGLRPASAQASLRASSTIVSCLPRRCQRSLQGACHDGQVCTGASAGTSGGGSRSVRRPLTTACDSPDRAISRGIRCIGGGGNCSSSPGRYGRDAGRETIIGHDPVEEGRCEAAIDDAVVRRSRSARAGRGEEVEMAGAVQVHRRGLLESIPPLRMRRDGEHRDQAFVMDSHRPWISGSGYVRCRARFCPCIGGIQQHRIVESHLGQELLAQLVHVPSDRVHVGIRPVVPSPCSAVPDEALHATSLRYSGYLPSNAKSMPTLNNMMKCGTQRDVRSRSKSTPLEVPLDARLALQDEELVDLPFFRREHVVATGTSAIPVGVCRRCAFQLAARSSRCTDSCAPPPSAWRSSRRYAERGSCWRCSSSPPPRARSWLSGPDAAAGLAWSRAERSDPGSLPARSRPSGARRCG